MTTVNQTNGASGVGTTANTQSTNGEAFTAQAGAVAEYDTQVNEAKDGMEAVTAQKQEVRQDKLDVSKIDYKAKDYKIYVDANGISWTTYHPHNGTEAKGKELSYQEWQALAAKAAEYGAAVPQANNENGNGWVYLKKEDYDKFIADLGSAMDDKVTNLNETSEMDMIRFQSLMDARKQALMMLTNMMQSASQTSQGIIQNMKG